jgi:ceramide glucosyltransferase
MRLANATAFFPPMLPHVLVLAAWALLAISAIGCLYLGASAIAVRRLVRAPVPETQTGPVTILKPLCGEDAGLMDNLRSFCRQHGEFQIVFGVREEDDPAVPVVRRLIAEFPGADLALVVQWRRRGSNLKIANLHNMLPLARHPILAISDSDMRVGPDYLAAVSAPLADPKVGIVTCLYRGVPAAAAGGLSTYLACSHINHGFLPQAALAKSLGERAGCFGASVALRRDMLDRAGGLAAIEDTLADDYALGAAVRRAGGRILLSPYLIDNVIAEPSLRALFRHELRWARTIRLVAPVGFLGSAVTHPVVLAALALATGAIPAAAAGMLGLAFLCRCAQVRAVDRALGLQATPFHRLPVRDLLSFAVFVASFFVRRVEWRDRVFGVGARGNLTLDGDSPA